MRGAIAGLVCLALLNFPQGLTRPAVGRSLLVDDKTKIAQALKQAQGFVEAMGTFDPDKYADGTLKKNLAGLGKTLTPLAGGFGAVLQVVFVLLQSGADPNAPVLNAISGVSSQLKTLQSTVDRLADDLIGAAALDRYKDKRADVYQVVQASRRFGKLANNDAKKDLVNACLMHDPKIFLAYLADEAKDGGECQIGSCLLKDGVISKADFGLPVTAKLLVLFVKDAAVAQAMDEVCNRAKGADPETRKADDKSATVKVHNLGERLDQFKFAVQLGFFQGSLPGQPADPDHGFEHDVLKSLNTDFDNQRKADLIHGDLSSKYPQFVWTVLVWDGFTGKGPKNFQKILQSSPDCSSIPPASTCGSDSVGGAHGEINENEHTGGGKTSFYITFAPPYENVDIPALDARVGAAAAGCNLKPAANVEGGLDTQDTFDCLVSALQDTHTLHGLAIVARGNGHTGFNGGGAGASLVRLQVSKNDGDDTTIEIVTAAKPK